MYDSIYCWGESIPFWLRQISFENTNMRSRQLTAGYAAKRKSFIGKKNSYSTDE